MLLCYGLLLDYSVLYYGIVSVKFIQGTRLFDAVSGPLHLFVGLRVGLRNLLH